MLIKFLDFVNKHKKICYNKDIVDDAGNRFGFKTLFLTMLKVKHSKRDFLRHTFACMMRITLYYGI